MEVKVTRGAEMGWCPGNEIGNTRCGEHWADSRIEVLCLEGRPMAQQNTCIHRSDHRSRGQVTLVKILVLLLYDADKVGDLMAVIASLPHPVVDYTLAILVLDSRGDADCAALRDSSSICALDALS